MFNSLSERLSKSLQSMGKKARLTEDNIASTLKEVRKALLEADVALPVVKQFISQVRTRALGREVRASLTPGQQFLESCSKRTRGVLGGPSESLNLPNVRQQSFYWLVFRVRVKRQQLPNWLKSHQSGKEKSLIGQRRRTPPRCDGATDDTGCAD